MKYIIGLVLSVMIMPALAQSDYWQQEAHYRINVTLSVLNNSLSASLHLRYVNHSPDTLSFIWMHLWPNAYANDSTPMARQFQKINSYEWKRTLRIPGEIDSLHFTVNQQPVQVLSGNDGDEMVRLLLPAPLLPGQEVIIETPFRVRLPNYYSRSGVSGNQFMICQWYPKPAVYDRFGWHPMPYLDQGEFYSEFGSFEVNISVPADFVVAATGQLQTEAELKKYRAIGRNNLLSRNRRERYQAEASSLSPTKTLTFKADSVHDFAWFADRNFIIRYDTLTLASGKSVDVFSYSNDQPGGSWHRSTGFIKRAVHFYSHFIGEYPYPVVQAVEGPQNSNSGGMEYPMITLITMRNADRESLDAVIAHEVGHNWFYGILATNERTWPWMDEGLNTFYELRYEITYYRNVGFIPGAYKTLMTAGSDEEAVDRYFDLMVLQTANYPINTPADSFSNSGQYGLVVYQKAAVWLNMVKSELGWNRFDKAMRDYYHQWRFRHPGPDDFQKALEASGGISLAVYFAMLNQSGSF